MEEPFFSVVLPTYNRARMLRSAVRSVLAQTRGDFELFVLDDGSTDDTAGAMRALGDDRRVRFFRFEDNRRQHARRNFAIQRARGRFVCFIDSDDLWLPERLERFGAALSARPEADFWFSNAYVLRDGLITGLVFDPDRAIPEGKVPGWYAVGDANLPYLTTNLAVRREAFSKVGLFREDMRILEDTELYARMLQAGLKVGVLREPLAVRRLHEAQITHDYLVDYRESLMALQAGRIPREDLPREKARLAWATAGYLLKGLRPGEARNFLEREIGPGARLSLLYGLTFLPRPALAAAKKARGAWLRLRRRRALAGPEAERVRAFIAPLLAAEQA